jgi:hypothetical protein
MLRLFRGPWAVWLAVPALLAAFAARAEAQYVVVPAPRVVSYYYAPPPAVTYYAPAPVVSYYPPAGTVTTYRYGAILPRRRVTVTTYTPAYVAPAPVVRYYYSPAYFYP